MQERSGRMALRMSAPEIEVAAARAAADLYERACRWGWLARGWAVLTRRPRNLLELATLEAAAGPGSRWYAGRQVVPLHKIRGTESRGHDFDAAFRPRQAYLRPRWLGIAMATHLGHTLPPIDVIQVGEIYFVRDGHHRVSVARALRQAYIEATVTVWQPDSPPAAAALPAAAPASLRPAGCAECP